MKIETHAKGLQRRFGQVGLDCVSAALEHEAETLSLKQTLDHRAGRCGGFPEPLGTGRQPARELIDCRQRRVEQLHQSLDRRGSLLRVSAEEKAGLVDVVQSKVGLVVACDLQKTIDMAEAEVIADSAVIIFVGEYRKLIVILLYLSNFHPHPGRGVLLGERGERDNRESDNGKDSFHVFSCLLSLIYKE